MTLASCSKREEAILQTPEPQMEFSLLCPGDGDADDPIIQGNLKDDGGNTISGAFIEFFEGSTALGSTSSDSDGDFCYQTQEGERQLVISAAGFQTDTVSFRAVNDTTLSIELIRL